MGHQSILPRASPYGTSGGMGGWEIAAGMNAVSLLSAVMFFLPFPEKGGIRMSGKMKKNGKAASKKMGKEEGKKSSKLEREFHKTAQRIMRKTIRSTHH